MEHQGGKGGGGGNKQNCPKLEMSYANVKHDSHYDLLYILFSNPLPHITHSKHIVAFLLHSSPITPYHPGPPLLVMSQNCPFQGRLGTYMG